MKVEKVYQVFRPMTVQSLSDKFSRNNYKTLNLSNRNRNKKERSFKSILDSIKKNHKNS